MIVVTGGAGLIGSALLRHLLTHRRGTLAVVERLGTDGRYDNLSGLDLAEFWDADDFLRRVENGGALPPIEALVHLGACSSTTEPDARFLMENNFAYSRTLAIWCLQHDIRFLYASSAATYGDGSLGYSDDLRCLPRLRPRSPYAFSKHAFDLWALHQGAFHGRNPITGLKYFNVFGPREAHKGGMRSMVLKAWEQIRDSGTVELFRSHRPGFADGNQERDFIYVNDAAAITAWLLDHPAAGGLFNVGAGVARTWNDLVRGVFAALHREPRVKYIAMPANLRQHYQYSTRADLHRLRAAGWQGAITPMEDGIRDYVQNYLQADAPGQESAGQ